MLKKVRIRAKIFFIVLVAVLPTVFFSVYSAVSFQRTNLSERATFIENLCDGFTNEQRLIVRNAEQMLLAISQTRSVKWKEHQFLNRYLRDLMFLYPDYAVLLCADNDGLVFASSVGKTGYRLEDRRYLQNARANGAFTVGHYLISRSTGIPAITFTLPTRDVEGKFLFLIATYSLEKYARELSLNRLQNGEILEICDETGLLLFSTEPDGERRVGTPVNEELFRRMKEYQRVDPFRQTIDGKSWLITANSYERNGTSLYLSVRVSYGKVLRESFIPVARVLLFMLFACVCAFFLSLALAQRLFVTRIERLTDYTDALAQGNLSVRSGLNNAKDEITVLMESFNTMAASLEERNAANEQSIREKESLLQELQKRVSDNLQLLSSMINLQIGYAADDGVRLSLMTTHSRVMALALVYDTIYRYSDVQLVQMHRYCRGLCENLVSMYADVGKDIDCAVSGTDVALPIDKALPVALIINELVSNSIVHAFTDRAGGRIGILFTMDGDSTLCVTISDDGSGFESDLKHVDSLGYEMIEALVEQIRGTLTVESGPSGSHVTVRFRYVRLD